MTATEAASDETSDETGRRARLLFRNRDYTGWWIGETVSEFGGALSVVAYPLLILGVTGSASGAGAVTAAVSIGGLVTMLIGGALADRISRRTILTAGPLVQAVAVATVVVAVATDHVNVAHIAAVGFVQGLVSGLAGGAEFAALRRVVPEQQLPTAFAQLQGRTMAIRLAGPSAGGFLFGVARWIPFFGDAVSFLASALGVLLIRRPLGPDLDEREPHESMVASIGAGFRFIRGNAYLRFLTIWAALANACNAGMLLLVIVLIHSRHGSATLVGAATSLGAVGGLAGSFLSGRIAKRVPGRLLVIVVSWTTTGVLIGIALVSQAWLIGTLLALMMFLIAPINVVFATYEARTIPDALMGRVTSAINFGAASIRWLGALGAGALASAFSPTAAMLVFAGILAAIALSTHFASGLHVLNEPIDDATAD
ncbi:MFS transporter [Streptacidiphilus sp. EB103A]|uniref:MFS transporter n=1 Tax=Streptacidiphilus sp. EB103A TaxID=3156275 RepID=UPI003517330C